MQYEEALDRIAEEFLDQISGDLYGGDLMSTTDFKEFIDNDPLIQYIKDSTIIIELAGAIRCNKKLLEKIIKNNKMIT